MRPSVRKLNPSLWRGNPYFRHIRVPEKKCGRWQLTNLRYAPYEAFIRDDLTLTEDFREIPAVGFFDEEFVYPAVLENGREWMTVTPNEIATMKEAVSRARGTVVAFGLGLGYFAHMASEKGEVSRVVVIERDEEVIRLFKEELLPQFSRAGKIEIVSADAFDFVQRGMDGRRPDFAFVDLWHDVSDGIGPYLRMKKLEGRYPDTEFCYWIERSLLSNIRFHQFWLAADAIEAGGGESVPETDALRGMLTDEALRASAVRLERPDQPVWELQGQ